MTRSPLERLLEDGILPNASQINSITADNRIVVLVFELQSDITRSVARMLGWTGKSPVLSLSTKTAKLLAATFAEWGDPVTAGWLLRKDGPARIFVLMHEGTLLLNFANGEFALEPGSLDHEREAAS